MAIHHIVVTDEDGIVQREDDIAAPDHWSKNAVQIATSKYLLDSERSIDEWLRRVAHGVALDKKHLEDELFDIMRDQRATFNSPVHFNVGRVDNPQGWACLIFGIEDAFDGPGGISDWWKTETDTFRNGSGAGLNVSALRALGEPLRGTKMGRASGPISFMRVADAIGGVVTSGGRTRRAAKMVIMDADHPDIEAFIETKVYAERVARDLRSAGYEVGINGKDRWLVPYQNANNSVRVNDVFMQAIGDETSWPLRYRLDNSIAKQVSATQLWQRIAEASWEVADPGLQFDDAIQLWHTCPNDGRIDASNPCSEYLFLNDTVCNLGSLNLLKFFVPNKDGVRFLFREFVNTIWAMVEAMDNIVDISSYPNETIAAKNPQYRTLGLGYSNLGALLMMLGLPYDSDEGRMLASLVTSLMQAEAYMQSALLAADWGPYERYEANEETHLNVLQMHASAAHRIPAVPQISTHRLFPLFEELFRLGGAAWDEALRLAGLHGLRNAQVSVIAPTGTISLVMDCETSGIEPFFVIPGVDGAALEKTLVGGGSLTWEDLSPSVKSARELVIAKGGTEPVYADRVFETTNGHRPLRPEAHVLMMAAVQPFISGGISKTANMPNDSTVQDVEGIHMLAWESGVKAVAVYRDGCKVDQPLNVVKRKGAEVISVEREIDPTLPVNTVPVSFLGHDHADMNTHIAVGAPDHSHQRARMPGTRYSITHKFEIDQQEFYLTAGFYDQRMTRLGEIFIRGAKMGSMSAGFADAWAIAISMDLQHGRPFEDLRDKYAHQQFDPSGPVVSDSPIKFARSLPDYVFRYLDWFMSDGGREQMEYKGGTQLPLPAGLVLPNLALEESVAATPIRDTSRECPMCHRMTLVWTGTCKSCTDGSCLYRSGGCE